MAFLFIGKPFLFMEYRLSVEDLVESQMYASTKSDFHKKRRKRSRWLITIFYVIVGVYLIAYENYAPGLSFAIIGIAWYFLYPLYATWRYRSFFKKQTTKFFKDLTEKTLYFTFEANHLVSSDGDNESKVAWKELSAFIEVDHHFFITLNNGNTLVLPKSEIEDKNELIQIFKNKDVDFIQDFNWKFS